MIAILETEVASLAEQIRARTAGGAAVWEVTGLNLPQWMQDEIGGEPVEAAFVSFHAIVAILANGRKIVRRLPERH